MLLAIQSALKLAKVLLLFGRDGLSGKIVVILVVIGQQNKAPLLRSPCVPCAFPVDSLAKSAFPLLICITVESMTSPIVITLGSSILMKCLGKSLLFKLSR